MGLKVPRCHKHHPDFTNKRNFCKKHKILMFVMFVTSGLPLGVSICLSLVQMSWLSFFVAFLLTYCYCSLKSSWCTLLSENTHTSLSSRLGEGPISIGIAEYSHCYSKENCKKSFLWSPSDSTGSGALAVPYHTQL